jgi:hypothetical protein
MTMYTVSQQVYCDPSAAANGMASALSVQTWIMQYGPCSIAVAAGDDWDNYQSGEVLANTNCTPADVNHAVVNFGWKVLPAGYVMRVTSTGGETLDKPPITVNPGWKSFPLKDGTWRHCPLPTQRTLTAPQLVWLVDNSWDGWGGTDAAGDGTCYILDGAEQVNTEAFGVVVSAVTPTPPAPPTPPTPPAPPTPDPLPVPMLAIEIDGDGVPAGDFVIKSAGLWGNRCSGSALDDIPAGTYYLTADEG